mgnify:CR=1 FL=1
MRIAILTPTFSEFSGIDRLVQSEAEELAKKGHDVTIFTLSATMKPSHAKLEIMGMPKNPVLERMYRLFFFFDFIKVRRYVKKLEHYDKVVSHFYPMNILAKKAKQKYGVEYIYYDAGVGNPELFQNFAERLYMRLFKFFTDRTARSADKAISISRYLAKQLEKDIGLRAEVKYIKVDKKRFNPKVSGARIRRRYGLNGKKVVLYVGRISPHKGIHLLIEAFKLAQKSIPNMKLLIVGKHTFPSYSKKLKKISNKDIIFTGMVKDEDLPQFYAACDVYATATLWEGYNIPVVEAQSCGKPVVAFNLCSHPEVVKKGILVKPRDVKGFSEAIIKTLKKS